MKSSSISGIQFLIIRYEVILGKPSGIAERQITSDDAKLKTYPKGQDKGKLKDTNYSEYNYFTEVEEYDKNTAKHILSLPKKVTVKDKNTQYRHIVATYDTNFPNHLKTITQTLDKGGAIAVVEMEYDAYGNIKSKKLPVNATGQRMTYTYEYDDKYKMYVTKVTDAFGYSSSLTEYNYQYGIPRVTTDINGKTMITEIDNLGRVEKIKGPNETDYTLKFDYYPKPGVTNGNLLTAYAVTQHFDVNYPNDPIETVTFADGLGRPLQVKKDGEVWNSNTKTADKVMIVSGRVKYDAFGRVQKAFMPVTETDVSLKYVFNPAWGADPTESVYDILDRTTSVKLPDGNETKTTYSLTGDGLQKVLVEDAEKHTQATFYNGSGKVVRTEQYSGPDGTITTAFEYDGINQLIKVFDTKKSVTLSEYDMAGRRTKVTHPASGITTFTFDASGNLTEKLTANLATNKQNPIKYSYDYNRLKEINYPAHPENDVRYIYGGTDAADNQIGRLIYVEDGSGAQQFSYGNMGELTEVRRTLIVPNQAVATYVTQWTYDSWNRVQTMKYPDGEVLTYGYNSAGLLTSVKGEKNNQKYDYVSAIGYDMYEQRSYMKYGNGTETAYNYNAKNRTLNTLQVVDKNSKALMNNTYTYDNVYNIRSVENNVTPTNGLGGYIKHEYQYDGLYRLKHASGSFNNNKASYTLDMTYDNLHNITHKKQQVQQTDMQFAGTLKAGYDLTYAYKYNPQQISTLADESYRNATDNNGTTGTTENEPNKKAQVYSYDSNGNLTAIESGQFGADGTTLNKSTERRLLWDEENRLLAVTDNGFVSNYWYDAAGERTVKESGDGEGVQINGVLSGARTGTANYTVYVSPYTVVSNGGQMSKHIYIGSQRIVSKLIDAGTMDDPRNTAKATYTGNSLNYNAKYATQTATVKSRYEVLGVIYRGKDNAGAGFYTAVPPPVKENSEYFYHSDHLGSSSLITDIDGNLVQHIEYVPFGEVFIDERTVTNKWSTPYKFNAKELDDETGLYYYGARYYDPRTSVWISVDPLAEKMPNISSYVYCFDNPVRYIDPDGRYGSDGHYWTAYAMCISMGLSNEKSLEFAAHAERYDNVIKNSSSIQNTDLSKVRTKDGLATYINPTTQGSMHGLNGGSQKEVNFIAILEALNGNPDAIHLLGDSYAHATAKSKYKEMYPRGKGHLWSKEDPDNIQKHQGQYNDYLNDLQMVIGLLTNSNGSVDRTVFNIIAKNGNVDERTDILKGYIASKVGQSYTTSTCSNNIRQAFNQLGINYTIQTKNESFFFGLFKINRVISFTVTNQQTRQQ